MKANLPYLGVVLAACLVAISCTNPLSDKPRESKGNGVLSLTLSGVAGAAETGARTIVPGAGDIAIASFGITLSRSGHADKTATFISPTTSGDITGLEAGVWAITVTGNTANNIIIATGTATVDVVLPGPTTASVSLEYLDASVGNAGSLLITLVFPKSVGITEGIPGVVATLDGSVISPAVTVVDNGDTINNKVVCAVSGITAASPLLRIRLIKDSTALLFWAERIWIYKNITTTNVSTLVSTDFASAPDAPTSLSAVLEADGSVALTWPNVAIAETYALERSEDGGTSYTEVVAELPAGTLTYTDSLPLTEKTYRYRITATNTFGTSAVTVNTVDVTVSPAFIVDSDKASIEITSAAGDSVSSVTQDLVLVSNPTSGTIVTWASSNSAITDAGVVTRPNGTDAIVILTATISRSGVSDTKVFTLTVKATATSGITVTLPAAPTAANLVFQNAGSAITGFTVTRGTPVTVTTTFAGATSYAWYVDGNATAVSSSASCEINGNSYTAGNHTLLLDVLSGGRYYSGRIDFTVITPTVIPSWAAVGAAEGLSDGSARLTDIAINSAGIPYVVYRDEEAGIKATVKKYNGLAWETVGSAGFSAGLIWSADIAISSSGTPYVAYWDDNWGDRITVMKFNGTSWEVVGNAGFVGYYAIPRIALDSAGTPYVTFADNTSGDRVTVMKFNGTSWEAVGATGFSAGAAWGVCIAFDSANTPYIAYMDGANAQKVTVQKFDGTNWVLVGTAGFTPNSINYLNIAIDSSGNPYVAFMDTVTYKANVMKFSGGTWASVGAANFTGQINRGMCFAIHSGTPYIVLDDETNNYKTTTLKFNGTNWVTAGNAGFSPGMFFNPNIAISSTGIPYVVFVNEVMDFGPPDPEAEPAIQKAMVMKLE